jgi:HPt (histidine-containing phosphotransfer) domain-containing protein
MGNSVFSNDMDLDSSFLDTVYENDTETAIEVFQQYLQDLPSDLSSINESFESGVRDKFLSLIHKKKVVFSYVGLTDVTTRLSELEIKCTSTDDIKKYRGDVISVLDRINSATGAVRTVLSRLQQDLR